jgi:hypothetical protein
MDLPLYWRVVKRFRWLVAGGAVLGALLAFLAVARVNSHGVSWRQQPEYLSYSQVFVTQRGFPWGRLGVTDQSVTGATLPSGQSSQVADPGRLTSLAVVYSELVTSDAVRREMHKFKPPVGKLEAAPVLDVTGHDPLPIVSIAGFSDTPQRAMKLAGSAAQGLVDYVAKQQRQNGIPVKDRVDLSIVVKADHAQLEQGRSIAMPAIVFLAVLGAAAALALVLENARPRSAEEAAPTAARHAA